MAGPKEWTKDASSQVPKSVPLELPTAADRSDSLILSEQKKALPKGIAEGDTIDTADADRAGAIKAATGKTEPELLRMVGDAEVVGRTFLQNNVSAARQRSHKAFRNEHFQGSKYLSPRYKTRSKVFKPKTRGAVRKSQAAAAGALFASTDVVTIAPQDNSNQQQLASASVKQELVNYRLDRHADGSSIPWFEVSMGAHQDAQIDGICVSKQFWKFQEEDDDQGGTIVTCDRPEILNIPPENCIIDPACDWRRPAQSSTFLIVRYPMLVSELRQKMKSTAFADDAAWLDIPEAELAELAGAAPDEVKAIRLARSGGSDDTENRSTGGSYRIIWVSEVFMRLDDGIDYCWWTISNQRMLSKPKRTRQAYPHLFGDRPYVIGKGALETHRPIPMAPVESWQQLQQEANDVTNLRLDQMKQVVTPLTKIVRGRQVDIDQVMRRGQDTVVMVMGKDDVEFDRPPDVPPSAMSEGNILNNDFDELAGTFSQSSIQSNRSMNETVGGMQLLAGGANSLTEFDLRVWVETWVEPVLWQVVKLEEYYESDEKVLALAGSKAQLVDKFGLDVITDHLLQEDVTITVAAGIGAADPMQGLAKFQQAATIFGTIVAPFIPQGAPPPMQPNFKEICDEVFSKAGYKNAGERFFTFMPGAEQPGQPGQPGAQPPGPPQPSPEQIQAQAESQDKQQDRQLKATIAQGNLEDRERQRQHEARIVGIKAQTELEKQRLATMAEREHRHLDHHHGVMETEHSKLLDQLFGERNARIAAAEGAVARRHDATLQHQDRQHAATQADVERQHSAAQASEDRAHQSKQAEAAAKAKAADAKAKDKAKPKKEAA